MKTFGLGSAEEKVHLIIAVLNPHVYSQPRAAQVELLRCSELQCQHPDLLLAYRAMESIFSAVFDKFEPRISLKQLGWPHHIHLDTIEKVAAFVDEELGALVLTGGSGLSAGLRLTDTQKARQQQIKEGEKKRAAAAHEKLKAVAQMPPATDAAAKAAFVKKPATTSMWANPCTSWQTKGLCSRGVSCLYAHAGFKVSGKRCITCGAKNHSSKDCSAPGRKQIPIIMQSGKIIASERHKRWAINQAKEKARVKMAQRERQRWWRMQR